MEVIIRPATAEDAQDIAEIMNDALAFKLSHGDTAWDKEPFTAEEVAKYFRPKKDFLIEADGNPVGRIALLWQDKMWPDDEQAGYIHSFAIKSEYRGKGLGEQVLEWCYQKIKEKGRKYARLDCPMSNKKLCAYYEKHGFALAQPSSHPDGKVSASSLYQKSL